ncbi:nucleotidyltransferase family protein [Litorilinea aerophila]|nr:nucleotidyltransferase domain-containing protein [Litorilinea aerophila]
MKQDPQAATLESTNMQEDVSDLQALRELVAPACKQFGVKELKLFGSHARGDSSVASDYDFVVTFDKAPTGTDRRSDRFFGLLFYLEEHLGRQVDLLEQEAIRNPYLLQAIERDKKLLYAA